MPHTDIPPPPTVSAADIGRRCLVTGGAGYVGSALVRRLRAAGCEVRSLDVRKHAHGEGVECVIGDLCSPADLARACADIDTVFHTAALINLSSFYRKAERDLVFRVNVEGTRQLLAAAAAAGVGAFVHTSTGNVVMDRVLEGCDESLPYGSRIRDLYGLTKIEAEKLALAADQPAAMRVCAIRPGGLWGEDVSSVMIRSVLDQLKAGRFRVLIGDGRSSMDNTHIENLLDGLLLAARGLRVNSAQVGGQAFFVFDGEAINPMQWFQPLVEGLGYAFPTRRLPKSLMMAIAAIMECAHYLGAPAPVLSLRAVRNLTESTSFRIDKARRLLGYEPRYQRDSGVAGLLPAARAYLQGP